MEFKELFALQKTAPIISFGDPIKYETIEFPDNMQENPEQSAMYGVVHKPPAAKEDAPKKKLTKAEQRRERQAERAREREERRERWRREQEERRQQPDSDEEEDDAAPAANGVLARLLANVRAAIAPAHVDVVVAAPALAVDINAPAVRQEFEARDPGARRVKFWEIIGRLQWHNASDGAIPRGNVDAVFRGLSAVDALTFKTEYENIFNGAMDFLNADGMFDRNGANGHADRAKIVSHIIALGEDQYTTLVGDPAILQFLVEAGECQSLNALLPDNIKV
jgi:hypothetical protein